MSISGSVGLTPAAHAAAERRRRMRFPVRAACFFAWQSREGGVICGAGWTADLSSDGLCVVAQGAPKPGEAIFVEVSLTCGAGRGMFSREFDRQVLPEVLTACGEGRVIWADTQRQRFGASVCFYLSGQPLSGDATLPA